MIEEVLVDIKAAEAKADELQKEAYQKGKQIVLDAELEAEKQKKNTVSECKADLKAATAEAEKLAAQKREEILAAGKKEAESFIKSKEKDIDGKSNEILDTLLHKYGCK